MTSRRILPPGETLPPKRSPGEKGSDTRPRGRKAGKGQRRGRQRHTDRFAVLNAFLDVTAKTLSRAPGLAWLVLYRDTRDGVARTSIADLASRVGCDQRSAKRAIRLLVEKGLVEVVHRGGKWRGVSIYRVTPVSPCMVTKPSRSR
jgi:hypothetical protein